MAKMWVRTWASPWTTPPLQQESSMENPNLDNIVLALLFAADEPLSARKSAATIEDVTTADVKDAIERWNARADQESWSIAIEQVAGGYRLATRAEYAPYVSRLF